MSSIALFIVLYIKFLGCSIVCTVIKYKLLGRDLHIMILSDNLIPFLTVSDLEGAWVKYVQQAHCGVLQPDCQFEVKMCLSC